MLMEGLDMKCGRPITSDTIAPPYWLSKKLDGE